MGKGRKMTLIIAAKVGESIVVGADSRALNIDRSGTRFMRDNSEKIISLNKYCCILMAGDSEVSFYLINKFKNKINKNDDIVSICNKLTSFCRKEFEPCSKLLTAGSRNYPDICFILTGLEKKRKKYKIPRIFLIKSWNFFLAGEEEEYAIVGKETITRYLFTKTYKNDLPLEKVTELIVQCLHDTEKIDGEAGGKIKVATINSKYGFIDVPTEEYVDRINMGDLIKLIEE
jgi:20S proteasome alpha/beta subunit